MRASKPAIAALGMVGVALLAVAVTRLAWDQPLGRQGDTDHDDSTELVQVATPTSPCEPATPPGGWAPWAFDEDGFKAYTMTLAAALTSYGFELPSYVPPGFALVEDLTSVVYMTGSDYTVHVMWQESSRQASGETITLYVKHGHPYDQHMPGGVSWMAPGGVEYELATIDPSVTHEQLVAMACSMAAYTGKCR